MSHHDEKYTGPDPSRTGGERMTEMTLGEKISPERQAEIDARKAAYRAAHGDKEIDFSDIHYKGDDDEFWENATVGWPPLVKPI
jgi:hypothetical protein